MPNGKGGVGGAFDTEQRRGFDPNYRGAYDCRERFDGQELGRATISRTIQDAAEETLIQEDEFEIIKHEYIDGDGKHEYTIVLAGVADLSSNGESLTEVGNRHLDIGLNPENYTVRDTDQFAITSSRNASVDDNRYAQMVREYVLETLPEGANVMIVCHSYGANTALDLAGDPAFNNPATGVNVTHVVSAAYYSQPQLSEVQGDTEVLVLQNTEDMVVVAEAVACTSEKAIAAPGNVFRQSKDTAGDFFDLNKQVWGRDPVGVFNNDVTRSVIDPDLPSWNELTPGAIGLFDDGVTTPADNIVVARFRGGNEGYVHKQTNYTDFVNGSDAVAIDPAIEAFYASVAEAGYGTRDERFAVNISVPNGAEQEVYFPGRSKLGQVRAVWEHVPGNEYIDFATGEALDGAKDVFDTADVVFANRERIRDAAEDAAGDFVNDRSDEFNLGKDEALDVMDDIGDLAGSGWSTVGSLRP